MINHLPRLAMTVVALSLGALALLSAGTQAASSKTKTLRIYEKARLVQLTGPDGRVRDQLPLPDPEAGDVIDTVFDLYRGDHRRHGAKRIGTDHVRCTFVAAGPPECISHANIGASQLVVTGTPPRVALGTGRFIGASGKVISAREVKGVPPSNIRHNDIDVVLRLRTAAR